MRSVVLDRHLDGLESVGANQQYGYRTLRVWHDAMSLTEQVYRLTASFPRHEVMGLSSQLQRAAVSIAEGRSRGYPGDYLRFISIARGSLGETETLIEIAGRLDYASSADVEALLDLCSRIGRQLHSLRTSVQAQQRQSSPSASAGTPRSPDS
jgi:four helix bundle protein